MGRWGSQCVLAHCTQRSRASAPCSIKQSVRYAQISKIGGGITNVLLKVAAPGHSGLDSAIVRVFGDNTDMYIDRDREIQVLLRLNEAGFGAKARTCLTPGILQ